MRWRYTLLYKLQFEGMNLFLAFLPVSECVQFGQSLNCVRNNYSFSFCFRVKKSQISFVDFRLLHRLCFFLRRRINEQNFIFMLARTKRIAMAEQNFIFRIATTKRIAMALFSNIMTRSLRSISIWSIDIHNIILLFI